MTAEPEQTAFVYTTYVRAGPGQVWQGLTDPAMTRRYWRHHQAGPKTFHSEWNKGCAQEMAHHNVGLVVRSPDQAILESEPPNRLAYTWHAVTPEWAAAVGMNEDTANTWRAEVRSKVAFDIEDVGHGVADQGLISVEGQSGVRGAPRQHEGFRPRKCRKALPVSDS